MTYESEIKSIAVLGANGFLGGNLVRYFLNSGYQVTQINRDCYESNIGKFFDVLINANGNSKRFWANQHPNEDYKLSVDSVKRSVSDFKFKKYFYISSSDVYPDHGNPQLSVEDSKIDINRLEAYGLHKYQAEQIVKTLPNYIILRMSAMVGQGLKKGVVKDILDGEDLFVTLATHLQFISTYEVGRVICELFKQNMENQIYNCGGMGSVSVGEMFCILNNICKIRPEAKKQEYEMGVQKLHNLVRLKHSKEYLINYANEK
jgi:dTDP-4-dehydrorhamnose reductase